MGLHVAHAVRLLARAKVNMPNAPDLQEWIRHAGGYRNIDWTAWDAAVASWREQYREQLERERMRGPVDNPPAAQPTRP
jgi:hypothetical protein